ncbi:response regulator [Spirosoma endophyticum]|uniref:Response regulatory domain-containing protein n=1 Tax=Spirosoma endophyticum TaxID=662367 RepID=A0A1I2HJ83_9BACT|nr:hypothetical protein [Spirosoma endophyticum]SFF29578.1 hypothetical protein SAMN05216167_1448 [Spirosoma endophyticum]
MSKLVNPKRRKADQAPILVIEDNANHWLIIRAALQQGFPEVTPVWASHATQALTYLQTASQEVSTNPGSFYKRSTYLAGMMDGPY